MHFFAFLPTLTHRLRVSSQNKQIRTVSLRRSCSDLFFTLMIHIKHCRRERPNGYPRRHSVAFSISPMPSFFVWSCSPLPPKCKIDRKTTLTNAFLSYIMEVPFQPKGEVGDPSTENAHDQKACCPAPCAPDFFVCGGLCPQQYRWQGIRIPE